MDFLAKALPFAKMGIPVFPLEPCAKVPAKGLMAWQAEATTDVSKIETWQTENSEFNCGLVAKKDGVCFLEFDVQGGMKAAAEEMGQPVPVTRVHRSGSGYAHYIFRHTEASNTLGNRQALCPEACTCAKQDNRKCTKYGCEDSAPHHHHEWFSLRSDNRYIVGAGSVHPNGNLYTILRNVEPTPIPDWVLEWVKKHSAVEAKHVGTSKDGSPVADDFDFDDFCAHYGEATEIAYPKDNNWYVTRICPATYEGPGTGRRHEGSTETGFYYDGSNLGFKCFAQGCPGSEMSIGKLLKHLNQYCEPYPENIWPERDISSFLDDVEWADDVEPDVLDVCEAVEVTEIPVVAKPEEILQPDAMEALLNGRPAPTVVSPIEAPELQFPELQFPMEAMPEGRFKRWLDHCCLGGLDAGLAAPALMGLASAIPSHDTMDGTRINMFVCLLAKVGAGKDTAIRRAAQVLGMDKHEGLLMSTYAPSGEKAISTLIGDRPAKKGQDAQKGPSRHVIVTYELEETLKKSRSETSGVLQAMQWFFDNNTKTYTDSKSGNCTKVDCRLSWVTAFPVGDVEVDTSAFKGAFGESTSHGLASRMIFGFSERKFDGRRSRNWVPDSGRTINFDGMEIEEADFRCEAGPCTQMAGPVVKGFLPEIEEQYFSWEPEQDLSGRDTYHIHKVALITAVLNGDEYITEDDWKFALAFMAWQNRIRKTFSPGRAKRVTQGEFNEVVLDEIAKRTKRLSESGESDRHGRIVENAKGKKFYYIRWKQAANSMRWAKYGIDVERTVDQLVRGGALGYLMEMEEHNGKEKDVENKSWVRIVNTW